MPDSAVAIEQDHLRRALLDQLAYLIDEIDALEMVVGRVPEGLQTVRPPRHYSLREIYGLLASFDAHIYLPRLHRMIAEDDPSFAPVDEDALVLAAGWNAIPLADILDPIREARRALLAFLKALPPEDWNRSATFGETHLDIYRLAHHITQHDADLLRIVGYRLNEM